MAKMTATTRAFAMIDEVDALEKERVGLLNCDDEISSKRIDVIGGCIEHLVVTLIREANKLPEPERKAIMNALDKQESDFSAMMDYITEQRPPTI